MTTFWSIWISVITLGSIIGCVVLLVWCIKAKMDVKEGEPMGHSFDGIEELNNPLPKWWTYLFFATIIFALLYLLAYPGLGNWKGLLGWTSTAKNIQSLAEGKAQATAGYNQYEQEMSKADAHFGEVFRSLAYQSNGQYVPIEELATNSNAMKVGQRLFLQNCAQCHGSSARGSTGFPNLTDNDWLWGGDGTSIKTTIMEGRQGQMTAWGTVLGPQGIQEMTAYVLSLSGRQVNTLDAQAGQSKFAICAACHGADGKGNHLFGAPNLTDNTWLYGGSKRAVQTTIEHGRNGVMPAWKDILGEDKVHVLAAYVYQLSKE
jgi:cytochrome c oxidase cbb3-type subunit 3